MHGIVEDMVADVILVRRVYWAVALGFQLWVEEQLFIWVLFDVVRAGIFQIESPSFCSLLSAACSESPYYTMCRRDQCQPISL